MSKDRHTFYENAKKWLEAASSEFNQPKKQEEPFEHWFARIQKEFSQQEKEKS